LFTFLNYSTKPVFSAGGRPSEVFCTDFLHNAKNPQRNINQGTDGDKSLFRVLDRWREEWNNGVQVPLSVTPPTYQFQQISLFPDMKIPEFHLYLFLLVCHSVFNKSFNYHRPKKLVAFNRKIYTEKHSSHFSTLVRPALHYYTIDEQDEEWLRNQQHHKIQSNTFLKVINHLEVTTYKVNCQVLHSQTNYELI
jgi:hypothetical protein